MLLTIFLFITVMTSIAAELTSEVAHEIPRSDTALRQNMRERLQGVRSIIDSLLSTKLERMPDIVNNKLRIPEDMHFPEKLARSDVNLQEIQDNKVTFHESLDEFMDVLKEKDMRESVAALQKVLQNCVECHTKFKQ
jgi:hypothetical protein